MSERVPKFVEKKHVLKDAVTLYVNGKIYEGWEDVQIVRELNALASDFQIKMTDKWRVGQEPWRIQPGNSAHIHIGKQAILTGYVDKIEASMDPNSRNITVSGRSKTADLVDCSVTGPNSYPLLNLKELAQKIIEPFKIPIYFRADPGNPFPAIIVQQGESVFTMLDRMAKMRKILMYPEANGGLIFSKIGTVKASTELIDGVNILSAKSTYDYTNRFSKYINKGQDIGANAQGDKLIGPIGIATDGAITRFRPLVIIAESVTDEGVVEDRAAYECGIRKGQSLKIEVTVQGWFQKDGTLWDINQIVPVDIGFLGVRRKMVVKKVTYNKNGSGTKATIELILPDAFAFDKNPKKESPLGWVKGLEVKQK